MMGRQKRVDDAGVLREMVLHPDPVITSKELSKRIDYSQDGARRRLHDLLENGYVESRTVGSNAVVWWVTDAGKRQLD
jgi:CTP-dependent riboflavin kinase